MSLTFTDCEWTWSIAKKILKADNSDKFEDMLAKRPHPFEDFLRPRGIHMNSSILHYATRQSALSCFTVLLTNIPNRMLLNIPDGQGRTCLHVAAENASIECFQLLLEKNVNVNARDDEGNTALHVLVQKYEKAGQSIKLKLGQCIEKLIDYPHIDKNAINNSKVTARELSQDESLKDIIDNHQTSHLTHTPAASDKWLMDVLNSMVDRNELLTKALFEQDLKNSDKNKIDQYYIGLYSFLCYAVKYYSVEVIQLLLDCGAQPTRRTLKRKLPLHIAIERGSLEITSLLLARMANEEEIIDLQYDSFSLIQQALKSIELNSVDNADPKACLARLLANDVLVNVNATCHSLNVNSTDARTTDGMKKKNKEKALTPLHIAASMNNQDAMKLLLMRGAYLLHPHEADDDFAGSYVLSVLECDTLCEAMNGCITAQQQAHTDKEDLDLDYSFLTPSEDKNDGLLQQCEILNIAKAPNYKNFFVHPLMKALLEVKWKTVRKISTITFWLNIAFHVLLVFLISPMTGTSLFENNSTEAPNLQDSFKANYTNDYNNVTISIFSLDDDFVFAREYVYETLLSGISIVLAIVVGSPFLRRIFEFFGHRSMGFMGNLTGTLLIAAALLAVSIFDIILGLGPSYVQHVKAWTLVICW